MTHDLPAMRRFKEMFRTQADGRDAAGTHLAAQLVADVEAEGTALIGAVPCPDNARHGVAFHSDPEGFIRDVFNEPCPSCGAAL